MGCLTPTGKDAGPFVYIEMCQKMITDNYGLLFLLLILVVVLVFLLIYFISEMKTSLSLYWKSLPEGKLKSATAQDDEIDDTINTKMATNKFDQSTKDFYKSVEEKYNIYNKEKTNYIKTTYEKDNDDIIDRKMLFPQYDNYDYSK